ncbi:MAG: T9SS type A sorting domain-containing protein [Fibrobacterota bacterium]
MRSLLLFIIVLSGVAMAQDCPPPEYLEAWQKKWDIEQFSSSLEPYYLAQPTSGESITVDGELTETSWASAFSESNKGYTWFNYTKWDVAAGPYALADYGGTFSDTGADFQAEVALLWKPDEGIYMAMKRRDDSYFTEESCVDWPNHYGRESIELIIDICNSDAAAIGTSGDISYCTGNYVYKVMVKLCEEATTAQLFVPDDPANADGYCGFIGGDAANPGEAPSFGYTSGDSDIRGIEFVMKKSADGTVINLELFFPFEVFAEADASGTCGNTGELGEGSIFGMNVIVSDADNDGSGVQLWKNGTHSQEGCGGDEQPDCIAELGCEWHRNYIGLGKYEHNHWSDGYLFPSFQLAPSVAIEDMVKSAKAESSVSVSPNPFNPSTVISYSGFAKNASVEVFDIKGNLIKTLGASDGKAVWNGLDASGNSVSSGIYVYKVTDGIKNLSGKMFLQK